MTYTAEELTSIRRLSILSALHALACSGSAGHGAFRARHCISADVTKRRPDAMNRGPLLAESHMTPGTAAVRPAITAPAPRVINKAGSAQHSSVDVLANSDRVGPISDLRSIVFIRRVPHHRVLYWRFGNRLF